MATKSASPELNSLPLNGYHPVHQNHDMNWSPNGNSSDGYMDRQPQASPTPNEYLHGLRDQFSKSLDVMEGLFRENAQLKQALENTKLDLLSTQEQTRELQRRTIKMKQTIEDNNADLNKNNYVLVLIDGDGMIFRNDLIVDGKAGGMEAADRLYKSVLELKRLKPIIRVFASIDRLASTFTEGGLTKNPNVFRQFTIGFSDPCHEHVDFINVGGGKEMADEKLKSELKWHLKNYNCKSIILGASHDNGYARVLNAVRCENNEALRKIQLLEGPPFGKELEDMPFNTIQFTEVFSTEKFDAFKSAQKTSGTKSPTTTQARTASISVSGNPPPPGSYAAALVTGPSYSPPASVGHGSPKPTKANIITESTAMKEAIRKVKQLHPKPCNNHYLKGDCMYTNSECKFGHEYILGPTDLSAMKKLAATKQCNWGQACINERCYYSHALDED
ncbi:hypothetical protein BZA77DRAFT_303700 [Pyronema omphalodes]|nr:hypothetical protein BZA77DRAFT_303700 [Pyronema omphalodes]